MIERLKFTEERVKKIEYQRIHRVPSAQKPRPIKARFLRFADKQAIQANAKLLRGSNIFILQDLPKRIREERKAQWPALKAAREAGKLAYFSNTDPAKLYVNRVWIPRKDQARFIESRMYQRGIVTGIRELRQAEKVGDSTREHGEKQMETDGGHSEEQLDGERRRKEQPRSEQGMMLVNQSGIAAASFERQGVDQEVASGGKGGSSGDHTRGTRMLAGTEKGNVISREMQGGDQGAVSGTEMGSFANSKGEEQAQTGEAKKQVHIKLV